MPHFNHRSAAKFPCWLIVLMTGAVAYGCKESSTKGAAKNGASSTAPGMGAPTAAEGPADVQFASLGGSWRSACQPTTSSGGTASGGSGAMTGTFTQAHFIARITFFTDAACTVPSMDLFKIYAYATGPLVGNGPLRLLSLTFQGRGMAAPTTATAAGLNSISQCGSTTWQAGVPKLYSASACLNGSPLVPFGTKTWNSYQVAGSTLTFGKSPEGEFIGVPTQAAVSTTLDSATAMTRSPSEDAIVAANLQLLLGPPEPSANGG